MAAGSGIITTQNLASTGQPTGGSYAEIDLPSGPQVINVDVSGTWTCVGGLIPELSLDGGATRHEITSTSQVLASTGSAGATVASGVDGLYAISISGPGKFYLVAEGAVTGRANITMFSGAGGPGLFGGGGGSGGGGGGGAVTIADGADVAEGSTTDAAVTTNAAGTVSGKLRGIVTLLAGILGINVSQINAHTVVEAGQNGTLAVGGKVAAGQAVSGATDPLLVAGSDYGGTPDVQTAKVDSSGTQYVSQVTGASLPTLDHSFGSVTTHVAKASPGTVQGLLVQSVDTVILYFQLFNRTGALSGGETPVKCYILGAGSATAPVTLLLGQDAFGQTGAAFSTGIVWGISTTMGTYTATADSAADFLVEILGS